VNNGVLAAVIGMLLMAAATAVFAPPVGATVLVTVEEALAQIFPEASTERQTLFLSEEQLGRIESLAGERPTSALVTRFVARAGGTIVGWAYLDTHRVRTLPETVMIAIDADGEIRRVEAVVFREPLDYLPPDRWYRQYDGRPLDDDLELKRAIRPITGATLTAVATTVAVRRALAAHQVLAEGEEAE
jgi:hypothetical protein